MRARAIGILFLGWTAASWGAPMGNVGPTFYPRTDLNVVVGGIPLEPGMSLTSWTALVPLPPAKPGRAPDFLGLGKMVLLEDEVPGALKKLQQQGFQVEAQWGPYWGGSPRVERLYFSGRAPQPQMAAALRVLGRFLARLQPRVSQGTTLPKRPLTPDPIPYSLKLTEAVWSTLEGILGPGQREGKLLSYLFPAGEMVMKEGAELPLNLENGTEFHFQRVEGQMMGEKRFIGPDPKTLQPVVAVMGQFALKAGEVEPVRTFLSQKGISLMAAEEHLKGETPPLLFLSFWAVGKPADLARTLKEALAKAGVSGPGPALTQSQAPQQTQHP